jgi:hypothetical protein
MKPRHLRHGAAAVAVTVAAVTGLGLTSESASAAGPSIETGVRTVIVNWGSHVDAAQVASAAGVLDALDNSGYLRGLAAAYSLSSRASYLGAAAVPDASLPSTTTNSAVDATLRARISAGALTAPVGSTNYVVMLPAASSGSSCSSHHAFTVGSTRAYVVVIADYSTTAQQCASGASDAAAATSVNVSEQLVNAITDPNGTGSGLTQTGTGAELGTACAAAGASGNVDGFPVQPWWSNVAGACSFGNAGVSLGADVPRVTNSRSATFRLHDTEAVATQPAFTCTLDGTSTPCDTARPVAVTGLAAGSHVLDVDVQAVGEATYAWLVDLVAPTASLLGPAAAVTVGRSVTVSFSGADPGGSGVAAYDVRYRAAAWNGGFGRWLQPPAWQGTAARRVVMSARPGHTYCFGVRAHDRADNVSASWSMTRCTTLPVDDRTLTAATAWHRVASASAYRGTLSVASTHGATLRLVKARFRRVALVVRTCPTCGRISVYRGAVLWRTVSTRSAHAHNRAVITLPAVGLRTATLSLKLASSGKPVYVDGLAVLQT